LLWVADLRAALSAGTRVALILGPLGKSDAVMRWLGEVTEFGVVEVLDAPPPVPALWDRVIDLRTSARGLLEAWFAEIFPDSSVARELAPAGRLVEEAIALGIESADDPRLSRTAGYMEIESTLLAVGGVRYFDFARILALIHPRPVQVGDEWVQLANRMGGGRLSIADLSMMLRDCGDSLVLGRNEDDDDVASFSTPFIARIVASRVKVSTSEHYAMFRALREMAVQSLLRNDAGDRFVATELPLQALAGQAVEELCDDGMALLAADPRVLIDVIEHPSSMISQGSKLVLRAAHRLGQTDTLSQVELAARRSSMVRLAEQIAEGSPARQWDPVWATSQPVNTNRVIFSARANVLCLSQNPLDPDRSCFAGLSNGTVWEISPYAEPRQVWLQSPDISEVRGIAGLAIAGEALVITGHSDQGVRAIDPVSGEVRWADTETMIGPLSSVAAAPSADGGIVAAGGVDGILALLDAATGDKLMKPIEFGVEIRGISILSSVVIVCLVDGEIVGIDRDAGTLLWRAVVPQVSEVCNSLAAVETPIGFRIIVGTSGGGVYISDSDSARLEPTFRELAQFESSVNSLALWFDGDESSVIAAFSDGSWAKLASGESPWRSYLGHVGSVSSVLVGGDGRVITGSGEGTVRAWIPRFVDSESVTLEWGVRHRGPVTGITIDLAASHGDVTHVTGGADGTLRAWSGPSDTTGARIAQHDSAIRALIWDPAAETAYVGHADGVLRTVARRNGDWETKLIGIQHDGVRGLTLSPVGRLYSTGVDGTVTRWHADLTAGGALTRQVSDFGYVGAIGWLNRAVVVGGQDGRIQLLNPFTLENIKTVDLGSSVLSVVGHERDLFVGLSNGDVAVLEEFDREKAPLERRIAVHDGEVRGIQAFELGGNIVIATTGLDRRLVVTDLRTNEKLADIALDGFGLDLHADPPYLAVSTTSGAMVICLSNELPGFLGTPKPLKPATRRR
jgi:WD40 repeat protein